MKTVKYRWNYPLEWLNEKIDTWDENTLRHELKTIAALLDSDQIQDLYESDMDKDGYFTPLKNINQSGSTATDLLIVTVGILSIGALAFTVAGLPALILLKALAEVLR